MRLSRLGAAAILKNPLPQSFLGNDTSPNRMVAISGFCPSGGARRMAETAVLLAEKVFPDVPLRQWVIRFPFPLRCLFAAHPQAMGKVLGIVYRAISTHLIHKAGLQIKDGAAGTVTLIQRFCSTY